MKEIIIAAAQSISIRGDVGKNIESHLRLIKNASENDVQLIVFPELSLTGYEPDLANELAFNLCDERLNPLKDISTIKNIIIIAGAPVKIGKDIQIGSFIIFPNNVSFVYTKHYLHPGEEKYFSPGRLNPVFAYENEVISPAICADITNPRHAEVAAINGATIYPAGVLITPNGIDVDSDSLKSYAEKYSMTVLMANHGGGSGGYKSAGRSAIWSSRGEIIAELNGLGEGLVIASKQNNCWNGKVII